MSEVLVASHIKPWAISNDKERLDVYNGLLLVPNLDKLFDLKLITFENNGQIVLSPQLSPNQIKKLNTSEDMEISNLNRNTIPYLEFHKLNLFRRKGKYKKTTTT